ncbi:hypothetical protein BDV32DRAFT_126128 [Aspergillus pseudonomiae]|uniref:Uncharacterized protein n=1 Tax=Aspergillus pseudonomiae TaxID=1506151 RepID=A0A5N6HVG6_9EURO|nr:uncharacterized protein BDV37DRAFT_248473 [Aspergillus pseudonomiae]KAB8258278.1 hypothetical protein BDV32DRAFT_126128 [Aspergillus pseudonomiae]KAE8403967.1 hypothetical protein BDV37DRAFT_248473 [Aspergillus pseudonomiae]
MSRKIIFLMGAPTMRSLQWNEEELLTAPVSPFQSSDIHNGEDLLFTDPNPVKWRLLQDERFVEAPDENPGLGIDRGTHFFTTQDLVAPSSLSTAPEDSTLTQFYDHSFTVHETSEITAPGVHLGDSAKESDIGADSTGTSIATEESLGLESPVQGGITDLQNIPSAAYLTSIVPQTMTVNLIVGIATIRPPRRIVTRRWKNELDLVEIVVGDDTRSGFGVTFWLPPVEKRIALGHHDESHELRKMLETLRPRDIVLLRMVGLSSFRERVYGQSLRKGITKVDLLHRQRVDVTDAGGMYSARSLMNHDTTAKNDELLRVKARKVREWIRRFVSTTTDLAGGDAREPTQRGPSLPPDTPEDSSRL